MLPNKPECCQFGGNFQLTKMSQGKLWSRIKVITEKFKIKSNISCILIEACIIMIGFTDVLNQTTQGLYSMLDQFLIQSFKCFMA